MAVIGKDGSFDPSSSSREKTDAELGHRSHNSVVGTKVVDNTKTMTSDSDDIAESKLDNIAHNKGSFLNNLFHKNKEQSGGDEVSAKGSGLPGKSKSNGSLGEGNVDPEDDDANNQGSKALEGVSKFLVKKLVSLILVAGVPGALIFFLIILAIVLTSVAQGILAVFDFGSDYYDPALNDDPKMGYYKDTLFEAVNIYESRSGCSIDVDYVHFTLMYPYLDGSKPNYEAMEDNILDVLDTFVEGTSCPSTQITYDVNGSLYNRLVNDASLRKYYADLLNKASVTDIDMEEAIEDVFDAAEASNRFEEELDKQSDDVLSSKALVTIKDTHKDYSMLEFMQNAVYAKMMELNLPINEDNFELMKAYVVVFDSEFIHNTGFQGNESHFEIDSGRIKPCNMETGCHKITSIQGSTYYVDGDDGSGNYTFQALDTDKKTLIKNAVSSAFGYVLTHKNDGSYYYPDPKVLNNVGNFTSIVSDSYPIARYSLIRISEPGYSGYVTYGKKEKKKINTIVYKQTDYSNKFCGLSGETISSSGCGVTAMAIVVSTYTNDRKYDPVFMMTEAFGGFSKKYCGAGISGTSRSFFKAEGSKYGYTTNVVYSNNDGLEKVMEALFRNTLVIIRVGKGHYTSGGHYMVISGIDTTNGDPLVYIDDPYNDVNVTKSGRLGSGWVSLNNIIAKETKEFYIISK